MRKRGSIAVVVLIMTAIAAIALFWPKSEPEYKGKKLHQWLVQQTEGVFGIVWP